jgi:hypothetical protein
MILTDILCGKIVMFNRCICVNHIDIIHEVSRMVLFAYRRNEEKTFLAA